MTVKFLYELGEMVADSDGSPGLVIERFPQVVTLPHEDGRPGNRAVYVAAYKVAFPALEDGATAFIVICEQLDLFPLTIFEELEEELERQQWWEDENAKIFGEDAEDCDEAAPVLRLVQ